VLESDGLWDALRTDHALIPNLVEEALRHVRRS